MKMKTLSVHDASSSLPQILAILLIIGICTIMFVSRMPSHESMNAAVIVKDKSIPNINASISNEECACHRGDGTKILNVGLPKSGTGTLNKLLAQMGCHSLHFDVFKKDLNITRFLKAPNFSSLPYKTRSETRGFTVDQLLNFENASFHSYVGPMMEFALRNNESLLYYLSESVDALSQMDYCLKLKEGPCVWPQLIHYELLYDQYPKALFVLMRRNISSHIESISNWFYRDSNLRARIVGHDVPYLPKGRGQTDEEMTQWIHGHYARIIRFFNHTQKRQERFIQFDIERDSIEKLKAFFHCKGDYELGHVHKTKKK